MSAIASYIASAATVLSSTLQSFDKDLFCSDKFDIKEFCKFHFDASKSHSDESVSLKEKYDFCVDQYNNRKSKVDQFNPFYDKQKTCFDDTQELDVQDVIFASYFYALFIMQFKQAVEYTIKGQYQTAFYSTLIGSGALVYSGLKLKTMVQNQHLLAAAAALVFGSYVGIIAPLQLDNRYRINQVPNRNNVFRVNVGQNI